MSNDKTQLYFSNNVSWQVKVQICDTLGFQRIDDMGKYLGVPVIQKRVNHQTY